MAKDALTTLKRAYKTARATWREDKSDKKARKKFKLAKQIYETAQTAAAVDSVEVEGAHAAESIDTNAKTAEKGDSIVIAGGAKTNAKALKKAFVTARAEWRADKSDKKARKRFRQAKQIYETAKNAAKDDSIATNGADKTELDLARAALDTSMLVAPDTETKSVSAVPPVASTQSVSVGAPPNTPTPAEGEMLPCRGCKAEFLFEDGEQAFYTKKGWPKPVRCKACRATRKAERGTTDPSDVATDAADVVGESLTCRECEREFIFPARDAEFYTKKGWANPVRCKECQAAKKERIQGGPNGPLDRRAADAKEEQAARRRPEKKNDSRRKGDGRSRSCYAFQNGTCKWGDACRFDHGEDKKGSGEPAGVCYSFQNGKCSKGNNCRFEHTKGVCYAFGKGECSRGDSCRFSHAQ